MAIFGLGGSTPYEKYKKVSAEKRNMAQNFEAWSVQIDTNDSKAEKEFRINRKGNTDPNEYNKILNQLSKDYIKMMDENGDGKLSYDEFEKFHEEELRDNNPNISDSEIESLKPSLKTIFERLNVDNENDSKDNLDTREIMNYFHTMDSFNDNFQNDGFISSDEYTETGIALSDKTSFGENMFKLLKYNFNALFKDYKQD